MRAKFLEWDSSFFNKKIGLLEVSNDCNSSDIENDFDLFYVLSNQDFTIKIKDYQQSYSENKVVFAKKIVLNYDLANENIFSITDDSAKLEIYELAFESGKYSRFKLDGNFEQTEFENLYKKWVDNSFSKEFADNVIVYKVQNNIVGFITYKVWGEYATIGLFAVCSKYQGCGIGKKLLLYVENELVINGTNQLRIPTQFQNQMACKFYTKMGYQITENKFLKHFWKI